MRRKKRITKARIDFISLCPKGKNKLSAIYKADGAVELNGPIVKSDMGEGTLTALAYVPGMEDTDGHLADADVIREMAHTFAQSGQGVDIKHDNKALNKADAFVAESFIVAKGDERFQDVKDRDGNAVDCEGAWAVVIKMENDALKKLYAEEGWEGISIGGVGLLEDVVEKEDDEGLMKRLLKMLGDFFTAEDSGTQEGATTRTDEEIDMTPEEVKKMVEETLSASLTKALPDMITKAVADAVKLEEEPKAKGEPIAFEGDPLSKEDIEAHLDQLRASEVDWTNSKAVSEYLASLEKSEPKKKAASAQRADLTKGDESDDSEAYFAAGAAAGKVFMGKEV